MDATESTERRTSYSETSSDVPCYGDADEDFTSGGLEAGFFENQASDRGYLNVHNDFGQMDHQVSCIFGSLANNALEYQMYDNNHHGTIASGRIRAYQYDMFDVSSLRKGIDTPLPEPAGCQVS
jgi:hypothetical protein